MAFLRPLFGFVTAEDNLRIIITRHGERADLALGPNWSSKMRRTGRHDSRISYLTPRADFNEWDYDPPLTRDGERQSMAIGRKLLKLGYPIDYCYSSPAYRSIQTADKILESQGRKAIPINIEPGTMKTNINIFFFNKNFFFLKVYSNVLHGMPMDHFHLYLRNIYQWIDILI
jgi:hypothetical protein